jgi:4-hydroxybenzoyl-CoA reductase subunit beta
MMRLPYFRFHTPETVEEAARILDGEGPDAMILAGGTDLLPNMKRGQHTPKHLVALRQIQPLKDVRNGTGLTIGAGLSLTALLGNETVQQNYTALWQAASLVATPQLRNMATLGGNICLDTRCNFYNQSEDWRKAIDYCLKKDGEICWVATSSKTCLAVSSTDTAPALIALGAKIRMVSAQGERVVDLKDFYNEDGINYMGRRANEILTEVILDPASAWKSTYWKLRRRGSFDFPVLSVAAAAKLSDDGTVEDARIVLGAVASKPMFSNEVIEFLIGKKIDDQVIEEAGRIATRVARPVDNTDLAPPWRKKVIPVYMSYALRELRGDDVTELRQKVAHQSRS